MKMMRERCTETDPTVLEKETRKAAKAEAKQKKRMKKYEQNMSILDIFGIDEVGRGPLVTGPVVACAVNPSERLRYFMAE